MLKLMLACCKVYISESRNRAALKSIEKAAKLLTNLKMTFTTELDIPLYPNPSYGFCSLKNASFAMVKAAFETIDLQEHCGTHPRVGVVDHICFHSLGTTSLDLVADTAKSFGFEVGSNLQDAALTGVRQAYLIHGSLSIIRAIIVPTFLYGAAHQEGRSLDSIRRELGYFRPSSIESQWTGGSELQTLQLKPDEGPVRATQAKGVITIGATRWVDNYNIPVFTNDISIVSKIAKRVGGRGGGLPSVQSMALTHGGGTIEVACNLLEPARIGGDQVQLEVERLAK
ncbi:hypothetical protein RND71_024860 [Anisodus tanguticus]|uniref:Formiminotransferase N-terminal subdomain domain-containing protein n=1 Tax=Anisodus tanguticus TaxID=243964 RepID=A0AAE1RNX8_9SOLA|nr:hypothetical protein RND71_024860 [Anisodus tanguticus]